MGRPRTHRRDLPERVYYSKGAYYYVHITTKWERLDSDYAKAMGKWAKLIQLPQRVTLVGELLDRYLIEVVPSKAERTQTDNRQEIRWLRTCFGGMALADLEPRHIVEYVSARRAKTRANREIALLSHAINKARLWGVYVGANPCSVPGIRNSEKARDRYVTDEEITQFKKEAPEWLKHYIDLKLLLGLRQRDLLLLDWSHITDSTIQVATMKTGKRLSIQITPEVREILNRLSKESPLLFVSKLGKPYSSAGFGAIWRRVMVKFVSSGGQRFTEHDLRGKVATDMGDAHAAKALLGHKKISMTEEYIKARKTDVVQPHTRSKKNGT